MDLSRGESFGFLGFDFRRVRSAAGALAAAVHAEAEARTAVLRKLKAVFRRFDSQPVGRVIAEINPIARWVNYFRIGHASRCFASVRSGSRRRSAALDAGEESSGLRLEEVE